MEKYWTNEGKWPTNDESGRDSEIQFKNDENEKKNQWILGK